MSGFYTKERNDNGDYEITFYTENRQDFEKVQDLCRELIDHDKPVSTEGDLISRSYLKQMLPAPIEDEYKRVHQIIDNIPSVKAIPNEEGYEMYGKGYLQGYERGKSERPKGEWIEKVECRGCFAGDKTVYSYTCPFCGVTEFKKYPFCHCGADMRGKEE